VRASDRYGFPAAECFPKSSTKTIAFVARINGFNGATLDELVESSLRKAFIG